MSSIAQSSLPSSPSTVSLASSLLDVRQLDSGIDIQEPPRPLSKRSNRDIRVSVADNENPQINAPRNQSSQRSVQQGVSPANVQKQLTKESKSPRIESHINEEDDSYFADILDKYCNSDEDPISTVTSTASGWKGLQSPEPPSPPVKRSYIRTTASSKQAEGTAVAAAASLGNNQLSSPSSDAHSQAGSNNQTRGRNSSASDLSSLPSTLNAATAKFNVYLQSASVGNSRESLLKSTSSSSSSPLLSSSQSPTSTVATASSTTRTYAKKPPPPPKDDSSSSFSLPSRPPSSTFRPSAKSSFYQQSARSHDGIYRNDSSVDLGESKPELPPKDSSRRALHNNNITGSSNLNSSKPPVLSLDTQSSGQLSSFSDVVEATMDKHNASASSPASGSYYNAEHGTQSHLSSQSGSRSMSSSGQNYPHNVSQQSASRPPEQQSYQHPKFDARLDESGKNQDYRHRQENNNHPRSRSVNENQVYSQRQSSSQYSLQSQQYPSKGSRHPLHGGSTSQLDLSWSGYKSQNNSSSNSLRTSNPPAPYHSERTRSYSHGSIYTNSSASLSAYPGSTRSLKSALMKTPIARARAKEIRGSRKVNFGEMITIVTIERAETPPPPPPMDKKTKKKLLQAKKNSSGKRGQMQNFDPEYNAAFFDAPYTPTPTEVVVTLAPWIGNPNYDEEKQNSKFYNEDDIDYEYDDDDDEYDMPYESDIRLGPEDDDEDDDEDEEDDDDDEEYASRKWGHGIAGPGGALPKKKGGMFKFKRAVNKLLRN
ncbi:hypothetical protein BGZ80_001112 [Entomortierella chlamydospora]|uniref:Uncharacterized protein n=1 Tax=Entomortierella chlamydospora TaxID=101097 RepID=A0A9P6SY65_9FUNG|nr:hypothetical protein BGZ79_003317 [Entomortierella chlamydospora]KAG0010882.1 hypothetical protein BGZ80_001112 [Entomortierella chlamydospora]